VAAWFSLSFTRAAAKRNDVRRKRKMAHEKLLSGKTIMGTVVQGGVGGAAYFVAAKAGPKVAFFQTRWWALPSAMLLGGHVIKRWGPEAGSAVCGAAGAMLAMSYYVQASGTATQPGTAPASGVFQGEAGAFGYVGPGDAGRMNYPDPTAAGAMQLPQGPASRYVMRRRSEAGALIT
jgi:hypothetical protein